ncbi:MAG: hypothetical protein OEY93_02850 [Anaerolineae bacterium]|nr:hypothetical protein [Anaerolineae bacterium]
MSQIILEDSDASEINITVNGSLRLRGWDRTQFRGDPNDEDALSVTQDGEKMEVNCTSGCTLRVPNSSKITVKRVSGDMVLKSIEELVVIEKVSGSLTVKSTGSIQAGSIMGDFSASNIEGNLDIKSISGDASVRDVEGSCTLDKVQGDFSLRGICLGLEVNSSGDSVLRLEPEPGGAYRVNAQGDIYCQIDPSIGAKVFIRSSSQGIRVQTSEIQESIETERYDFVSGEGETEFNLDAQGEVEFISASSSRSSEFGFDFDFEELSNLGPEIAQQVTSEIEKHLGNITSSISMDLNKAEKLKRKAEEMERRVHQKVKRSQLRIDRDMRRRAAAAEKMARQSARMQGRYRSAASDPVTDDERKKILQMVGEKKINVQEAELLLAALEGREPHIPSAESAGQDQTESSPSVPGDPVQDEE